MKHKSISALAVSAGLVLAVAAPAANAASPDRYAFSFVNADTINCVAFDPAWTFDT